MKKVLFLISLLSFGLVGCADTNYFSSDEFRYSNYFGADDDPLSDVKSGYQSQEGYLLSDFNSKDVSEPSADEIIDYDFMQTSLTLVPNNSNDVITDQVPVSSTVSSVSSSGTGSSKSYVIIGDSRIDGMKSNSKVQKTGVYLNVIWMSKVGASGSWVKESSNWTKLSNLSKDTVVIYEMGVNGVGATSKSGKACAKKEVAIVKDIKKLGFDSVYFCEVLGVDDKLCNGKYSCRNVAIKSFNKYINSNSGKSYKVLKCNTDLDVSNGGLSDGLHFSNNDFVYDWFNYVIEGAGGTVTTASSGGKYPQKVGKGV